MQPMNQEVADVVGADNSIAFFGMQTKMTDSGWKVASMARDAIKPAVGEKARAPEI